MSFAALTLTAATYEKNLERSFDATAGGKLVVEVDRGAITVTPDAGEKVHVRVFRQVKDASQAEADRLFAAHVVTFSQEGDKISVSAMNKESSSWSLGFRKPWVQVRYEVSVPKRFNVNLRTAGGDVAVPELEGNAIARTSSGLIDLGTIAGKVEAYNSGGDIRIRQAGDDLVARTSSGSIKVQEAKAKAQASNSGGDIRIDQAGAEVSAATSSGRIVLGTVSGNIRARNSGGDIKIEFAGGDLEVQTSSGEISVTRVKGETKAKNSGGNIAVGEAQAGVVAQTSSGKIEVKGAAGRIDAINSGGDISIGEGQSAISARTSSGSIRIKRAKGKIEARNSGGDINIGKAQGEAVVATSSGSIVITQAEAKAEVTNSGGGIAIGEARDVVVATTSSGEISVHFTSSPKAECRLEVSGGGIKVAVPAEAGLNLDARTSGGEVRSELPVSVTAVKTSESHGSLRGTINGGGPAMVLRASSGDIQVKKAAASAKPQEAEDPAL